MTTTPRAPAHPTASPSPAPGLPAARPSGPAVLVAHGRELVAQALCRVLSRAGFQPVRATSAEEAERLASHRSFDAVVADQAMEGLSGAKLLARLRLLRPEARRVLVTSPWDAPSQLSLTRAEAHDLLPKPFGAAELLAAVGAGRTAGAPAEGLAPAA